jgi:hypothetical protein
MDRKPWWALVLGEHDHALELLESALSVPSPVLMSGHPDLEPLWAPLWQNTRYKAALAKMKRRRPRA